MNYPTITIRNTPPELYYVAFLALEAVNTYGYEGRKQYTFYFYKKYKANVHKNMNGYSIKVSDIG